VLGVLPRRPVSLEHALLMLVEEEGVEQTQVIQLVDQEEVVQAVGPV
jgi:hypothetical protein